MGIPDTAAWEVRTSDGLGGFYAKADEVTADALAGWMSCGWTVRALSYSLPDFPEQPSGLSHEYERRSRLGSPWVSVDAYDVPHYAALGYLIRVKSPTNKETQ